MMDDKFILKEKRTGWYKTAGGVTANPNRVYSEFRFATQEEAQNFADEYDKGVYEPVSIDQAKEVVD